MNFDKHVPELMKEGICSSFFGKLRTTKPKNHAPGPGGFSRDRPHLSKRLVNIGVEGYEQVTACYRAFRILRLVLNVSAGLSSGKSIEMFGFIAFPPNEDGLCIRDHGCGGPGEGFCFQVLMASGVTSRASPPSLGEAGIRTVRDLCTQIETFINWPSDIGHAFTYRDLPA